MHQGSSGDPPGTLGFGPNNNDSGAPIIGVDGLLVIWVTSWHLFGRLEPGKDFALHNEKEAL